MKKQLLMAAAIATFGFLTACDEGNKTTTTETTNATEVAEDKNEQKFDDTKMENDAEWAVKAADGGMEEVMLGKLAQTKGTNPKVKELGKMMAEDHAKANEELKALAQKKGISLPAALSPERQKDYDNLNEKTGADFDKAYTAMMVDDHEDDIDLFQKAADDAKDADIKTWAAGKVPTLQHHLEMAKAARDAVK